MLITHETLAKRFLFPKITSVTWNQLAFADVLIDGSHLTLYQQFTRKPNCALSGRADSFL